MDKAKEDFERDGFAILPGFYPSMVIDRVLESVAQRKLERPLNVTVDLIDTGEEPSRQEAPRRGLLLITTAWLSA